MKTNRIILAALALLTVTGFAQTPSPSPTATPAPTPVVFTPVAVAAAPVQLKPVTITAADAAILFASAASAKRVDGSLVLSMTPGVTVQTFRVVRNRDGSFTLFVSIAP